MYYQYIKYILIINRSLFLQHGFRILSALWVSGLPVRLSGASYARFGHLQASLKLIEFLVEPRQLLTSMHIELIHKRNNLHQVQLDEL